MSPQEQVESYLHFLFDKAPSDLEMDTRYKSIGQNYDNPFRRHRYPIRHLFETISQSIVLSSEKKWDVYVGVLPYSSQSTLTWADTLWVDIDGGFYAPEDAQALLTQACVDRKIPGWNLRVESGTGIHAYW